MDKQKHISDLLIREGGEKYTNRPADRGGPTRWGVTERTARDFGYHGDMRLLPLSVAVDIYDQRYWHAQNIDYIAGYSESLAVCMFDFGVNSGPATSGVILQRLLNVLNNMEQFYGDIAEDGSVGPVTLESLGAFSRHRGQHGLDVLTAALNAMRIAFCVNLSVKDETQEANTYGWLCRVVGLVDH